MENRTGALTLVDERPQEVIASAQLAAKQLQAIVTSRKDKLVINKKQYLFFEDWQTLGKFYGTAARVLSTEEIVKNKVCIGYLAKAAAVCNGYEVSAAEADCTNTEPNWKAKPLFQLRSMAQTRACSKALRNCLGWVAVLAGYEAMPAEEATEHTGYCTMDQRKKIFAVASEMGYDKESLKAILKQKFDTVSTKELSVMEAGELINFIECSEVISPDEPEDETMWPGS